MANESFVDRLVTRIFEGRIREIAREIASSELGEEADHWKYRRLGPMGTERNLPEHDQTKMLKDAYYLFRYDPLARRMLELTKDFVVGEGITIKSKSPEVQRVIDKFWFDSVNNMPSKQHNKCLELGLYGEQCYPVFVNDASGHVRLGYLDPERIEDVMANPDNAEELVAVMMRTAPGDKKRAYRIVHETLPGTAHPGCLVGMKQGEVLEVKYSGGTQEAIDYVGSCFYFSVNKVSNATRGNSDLLPLIDWLFGFGDFLYNVQERQAFLWAFVWDVLKEGANEEQLLEWKKKHGSPKPGSLIVHNEAEKWNPLTPDLQGRDVTEITRTLRNFILGGLGIPEHWYSEGGYTNRATAQEMGEPSFKRLKARQDYFKFMLGHMVEFVLDQAILAKRLPQEIEEGIPTRTYFDVIVPDMRIKDVQGASSSMLQVTQGLLLATQNQWITQEKAAEVVAQVAAQFGVEVDVREVMEAVESLEYGGNGQGAVEEALKLIDERREKEEQGV